MESNKIHQYDHSDGQKQQDHNARALTAETKRTIAAETGRFYNLLIDTYLGDNSSKEVQEGTDQLLEALPGALKKLYSEGLVKLKEELKANHALLEQHRGDEIRFLLGSIMQSDGKSSEGMEEVFQQIDDATFLEPAPGVAIIQVEKAFYNLLQEHGVINGYGKAVNFGADNRNDPSFLIVQRMSLAKSLIEDRTQVKENNAVRHEFHHFVWNLLERRGDFLRIVSESSLELVKAFQLFRNEIIAYIIEGKVVGTIDPDMLVYSHDKEILRKAIDARDFISTCIEVAKQRGLDTQDFLYASIASRSFAEIKDNFVTLTPLEAIDPEIVGVLYSAWVQDYGVKQITEILERKGLTIPATQLEAYGEKWMASASFSTMDKVFKAVGSLKRFADSLNIGDIDEGELTKIGAKASSKLPMSTLDVILNLPPEQARNIPLILSHEAFLESVISLWDIDKESARAMYKKIIDSSPALRESFKAIVEKVIRKGSEEYRREGRAREGHEVESIIDERARLLRELSS